MAALSAQFDEAHVQLLVVCDGMGSAGNGAAAAREAIQSVASRLYFYGLRICAKARHARTTNVSIRDALLPIAQEWADTTRVDLTDAARQANAQLSSYTTTIVCTFAWEQHVAIWWLGDSRALRFRDRRLDRLTLDHSPVGELKLSGREELEHPELNQISRFLRPGESFPIGFEVLDWQDGDVLLLMSDGVWGAVLEEDLRVFLDYHLSSDVSPQALIEELLDYIQPNVTDNLGIAVSFRGNPDHSPGVPVRRIDFLRRGLSAPRLASVLNASAEPDDEDHSILAPINHAPVWLCEGCDRLILQGEFCDQHGGEQRYDGPFFEVWSPTGKLLRRARLTQSGLEIGRQLENSTEESGNETTISLDDYRVADTHFHVDRRGERTVRVIDHGSDGGTWQRIHEVEITERSLRAGVDIAVGSHIVSLGHTDREAWSHRTEEKRAANNISAASTNAEVPAGSDGAVPQAMPDPSHDAGDEPPSATQSGDSAPDLVAPEPMEDAPQPQKSVE